VLIGEAPGADEDAQGEPFVGRAGQLLNKILEAIQFKREDVYICNILKCRPPNNRDPQPEEIHACEPHLWKQIELIQPKLILCLGRISAQVLLKTNASLTELRAKVHNYRGIPMMVTYHPAALLRNPHWKRPTWEDVQKFRKLYDELKTT
jgi:DNA polymerase